ncbi:MAG: ABC transporter permease [Eubacterium sp.]|nr:ABC transporter permease [Eubacterium sp.]
MYKLFVIAKNNMKKQKGDMITFFILTFIAAFLIFDAGSAIMGLSKVLDSRFEETNGAHFVLFSHDSPEELECIEKAVRDHKYMKDFESTPCIMMTVEHKNGKDKDYGQYMFIANSMSEKPKYVNDLPDGDKYGENDILLPYYIQGTYKVGDTMNIKIGDNVYDFNVAGYVSDPYFCSSSNITIYYVFMSDSMIEKLKEDNPKAVDACFENKGIMDESYLTKNYTTMNLEKEITDSYKELLKPYIEEHPEKPYTDYLCVNWQIMRGGSQFIPLIIMAIVLLFATIIIVIAIVIISFSIKNFIYRNMKNTGILEASGYTVRELRRALSVQIVMIAALGAILGTAAAILTFKEFAGILEMAAGMKWNQPVNIVAAIMTMVIPTAVIYLVSRVNSRAYKKISVLDALRGGINTHNYKKNYFPFEKTPLPIPMVVSLKDTFGGLGRNIVMLLIVVVLTMSALIGFGMYENFGEDPKKVVNIMGFEDGTADVMSNDDIADELREIRGVTNVLSYCGLDITVRYEGEEASLYVLVMDDIENTTNLTILDGRVAKHDNEILITTGAAKDLGVKVGDVVEMEFAGKKAEYIITGTYQRMDHMGRGIYMPREAGERIVSGSMRLESIITTDGSITYDELKREIDIIDERYEGSFNVVDLSKQMEGTLGIVSDSMKMLCVVIAIITILIVIFVESLVIRAKIVKEWRGMGISKALGMTSGQLIAEIMMSNVPTIIVGMLIGTAVSRVAGEKLTVLIFSFFGISHVDFDISFIWMLVTAVGILLVALIASGLSGLKVRRLKPVEMITEE